MKPETKIPSVLALLILLAALIAGLLLTPKPLSFRSKASGDCRPQNLRLTNLTHTSFDVSFTTADPCLASLSLNDRLITDARWSGDSPPPQKIHYFRVNHLTPGTNYQFSLISGAVTYTSSDYSLATIQTPSGSPPNSNLAWGKVLTADLRPTGDALVFLVISGALPLSTYVTNDGNWSISLASSFNDQKTDWYRPLDNLPEDIIVVSGDGRTTQVTGNTSRNNPVPDIIIGQDNLTDNPVTPTTAGILNLSSPTIPVITSLELNNPADGEIISTLRPQFFGKAPADSILTIRVESPNRLEDSLTPLANGSWTWSPPTDLSPGNHTVSITSGSQTITRKFTILPNIEALAFTASASATPIPTATLTPTSTPTIPPRTAKISPSLAVPVSGNSLPTLSLLIVTLTALILALVLALAL